MNKIGIPNDFDVYKGYTSVKKGWVSFSRSKLYTTAPGAYGKAEVRFVFNYNELKRKYRNQPFADQFVTKSNDHDDLVKSFETRWESEERFYGPISLDHGLERIEILKSIFYQNLNIIKRREEDILEVKEKMKYLKKGVFWNRLKEQWMPIETDRQKRIYNETSYKNNILYLENNIKEIKNIFSNPKIVLVSSFK